MPVPRIAIVGRPNAGKSSLLNLLAGERIAIVDPTPGVTRDRVSTLIDLEAPSDSLPERAVELTDTGGFGVYTAEGGRYDEVGADLSTLTGDIEQQIAEAVTTADIILFAIDTQAGITPLDQQIAKMLREQRLGTRQRDDALIPVHVIATKCDGPKWEAHALEMSALGFGEPLMCSAKNKYLRRQTLEQLYDLLPEPTGDDDAPPVDMKLAIIGKRNAGKSSLVNALAGQNRVIVSEIAGTTRDAVDVRFDYGDKSILAIDTAGLRKKKSFQGPIEWYAFDRAKRSIERADCIVLMIDATEKISQVDEQLAMLVQKAHKPVVIAVNKWDLIEGRKNRYGNPLGPGDYSEYLRKELKGLTFAPIALISAADGTNLSDTVEIAWELFQQSSTRMGTGELNRLVQSIIDRNSPPGRGGKIGRAYYATQVATNPPTIVIIVNDTGIFGGSYERYMMNRFRDEVPFDEVPIRLILRPKRRDDDKRFEKLEAGDEQERYAFDKELLASLPDDPEEYFTD
ncbi:MAG: ribosome biogenesis GTPase Der [Planctomycetota bacterium]